MLDTILLILLAWPLMRVSGGSVLTLARFVLFCGWYILIEWPLRLLFWFLRVQPPYVGHRGRRRTPHLNYGENVWKHLAKQGRTNYHRH